MFINARCWWILLHWHLQQINMATDAMGLTGDKSEGSKNYKPQTTPQQHQKPQSGMSAAEPAAPAKPKNTTVLALKGGVQGKLDKATGKFTPGDFTDAEQTKIHCRWR